VRAHGNRQQLSMFVTAPSGWCLTALSSHTGHNLAYSPIGSKHPLN